MEITHTLKVPIRRPCQVPPPPSDNLPQQGRRITVHLFLFCLVQAPQSVSLRDNCIRSTSSQFGLLSHQVKHRQAGSRIRSCFSIKFRIQYNSSISYFSHIPLVRRNRSRIPRSVKSSLLPACSMPLARRPRMGPAPPQTVVRHRALLVEMLTSLCSICCALSYLFPFLSRYVCFPFCLYICTLLSLSFNLLRFPRRTTQRIHRLSRRFCSNKLVQFFGTGNLHCSPFSKLDASKVS